MVVGEGGMVLHTVVVGERNSTDRTNRIANWQPATLTTVNCQHLSSDTVLVRYSRACHLLYCQCTERLMAAPKI
jgi:hypothetical protein